MNMKTYGFILLAFLLSVFTACSSDDDTIHASLSFEQAYYERPLMRNDPMQKIPFTGGSGDFSLSVSNEEVLDAEMHNGYVYITPKEKGRMNIEVRDNASGESVTLQVKIVDAYIGFSVSPHIPSENPYFAEGDYVFFVNDENRSVYWFDESFNLKGTGSGYSFFYTEEPVDYYLSLALSGSEFTYSLTGSQHLLFSTIPHCLDLSWEKRTRAIANELPLEAFQAMDMETGNEYDFVFRNQEMPYGILE